jgi:hypothetical protein
MHNNKFESRVNSYTFRFRSGHEFQDECLNEHCFVLMRHAHRVIEE